jgi:hypothetical protein
MLLTHHRLAARACCLFLFSTIPAAWASPVPEQSPPGSMPLFYREDWKEIPAETPVTQEHVANPQLKLRLYGSARDQIKKSHHDQPADDPYYIWSGLCRGTWAVTLSRAGSQVDLSTGGLIRWRSRQSGDHFPRVLIRLANGAFYVSDQTDSNSGEWHVFDFVVERLTWSKLDIETFVPLPDEKDPDLSSVAEIGFTDLQEGRGSGHSSRIDWIEVYGETVDHGR